MSKVYFKPIKSYSNTEEINEVSTLLLDTLIKEENITLEKFIPLKVHFGEKGNKTFIEPKNFISIINYLKEKQVETGYIETNVLYRGERTTKEKHTKLALNHGFTQVPIIIADGEHGEDYDLVEINKKNFEKCKIAKEFSKYNQVIVFSHFKGHALAGFGGAIKQLAMGFASRGGKLDQHANSIPKISSLKCKSCKACVAKCPETAIIMGSKAKIVKDKCIGCASCMAVCPHGAITNSWLASITKSFSERLAEYAFAAAKNKNNIYITFAMNITRNCDCEGHKMEKIIDDVGIFASRDPLAIDKACLDVIDKINGKTVFKRGRRTLEYGEEIGLGSKTYELVEL